MSSLKNKIQSQIVEIKKSLAKLEESLERIENLKLYEVGIKKSSGEIYTLKYSVREDGNVMVTALNIPEYSNTASVYVISLDSWLNEYIEYSPSKRQLFPKG